MVGPVVGNVQKDLPLWLVHTRHWLFQRGFIERALARSGGNVTRAAESCGMTRAALQRILRALDIDRGAFASD